MEPAPALPARAERGNQGKPGRKAAPKLPPKATKKSVDQLEARENWEQRTDKDGNMYWFNGVSPADISTNTRILASVQFI